MSLRREETTPLRVERNPLQRVFDAASTGSLMSEKKTVANTTSRVALHRKNTHTSQYAHDIARQSVVDAVLGPVLGPGPLTLLQQAQEKAGRTTTGCGSCEAHLSTTNTAKDETPATEEKEKEKKRSGG